MAWDLSLHADVIEILKTVPPDILPQVDVALTRFAGDPRSLGHYPVHPFSWRGPVWDFVLRSENGRHFVTIFFLFDNNPAVERVYVHDILIRPAFVERAKVSGNPPEDEGGTISIPLHPPA